MGAPNFQVMDPDETAPGHQGTDEGGDPPCWAHLECDPEPVSDGDLAEMVRNLADAVIICDTGGNIVFWNAAATRLFGWPADQMLGASLDAIIPERLRARHWEGYHCAMAEGHTRHAGRVLEVPAIHRDGHTISIAFTVTLMASARETGIAGVAAVVRDDTERWKERRRASG